MPVKRNPRRDERQGFSTLDKLSVALNNFEFENPNIEKFGYQILQDAMLWYKSKQKRLHQERSQITAYHRVRAS